MFVLESISTRFRLTTMQQIAGRVLQTSSALNASHENCATDMLEEEFCNEEATFLNWMELQMCTAEL